MRAGRFTEAIPHILALNNFAVAGASRDTNKFGNRVYCFLKRAGYNVYAVNPHADSIDGDPVYPHLDNVPGPIDCVVTVVQPEVTFEIVRQAGQLQVPYMWMQPGSESESAVIEAHAQGIDVVHGGPCIMVEAQNRKAAMS